MTTIYKFDNTWVKSTVDVHADGSVTEIAGGRWWTAILDYQWDGPGTVFPTIDAWVSAMVTEINEMRDRSYRGRHYYELSYIPEDEAARSSVAWVLPEKRFMEIRRGLQTKLAPGECRYWPTVEKWCASLTPPENAVAVAGAAPAVAVKKEAAAAVPAVAVKKEEVAAVPAVVEGEPAFDAENFKANWDYLLSWVIKQSGPLHSAGVIQLTEYLLQSSAAASWLDENQCWYFCVRAQLQALSWSTEYKEAKEAVAAFLE
jgi:hypothetical protein